MWDMAKRSNSQVKESQNKKKENITEAIFEEILAGQCPPNEEKYKTT